MAPRYRRNSGATGDAALLAANRVLNKEDDYKKGVKTIQSSAVLLAERLTANGDIEQALLLVADDDETKKASAEAFLTKQRERLKSLAEKNVRGMRDIDAFLSAVGTVKEDIVRTRREANERTLEQDDDEDNEAAGGAKRAKDEPPPDYERSILDKVAEHKAREAPNQLDLADEDMVREMKTRLGEKPKKKQKKGRGGAGHDDDDDDDLEVVNDGHGADAESSLKCPITSLLFENPVKNKVCGHVYSRAGVDHLLRSSGRRGCPVAGCTNSSPITLGQVEEDLEMGMRVHRYRKRAEQEKRNRMSQADDEELVDEDEEEEAAAGGRGGGAGTTVID